MHYRRAEGITWDMSEDRAVVLDAGGATLITLNPAGTLLWRALDDPCDAEDLVERLEREFADVEVDQLRTDVTAFLRELLDEGLLVEAAGSG